MTHALFYLPPHRRPGMGDNVMTPARLSDSIRHVYFSHCNLKFISRRAEGPGDNETPPVRLSVCPSRLVFAL